MVSKRGFVICTSRERLSRRRHGAGKSAHRCRSPRHAAPRFSESVLRSVARCQGRFTATVCVVSASPTFPLSSSPAERRESLPQFCLSRWPCVKAHQQQMVLSPYVLNESVLQSGFSGFCTWESFGGGRVKDGRFNESNGPYSCRKYDYLFLLLFSSHLDSCCDE